MHKYYITNASASHFVVAGIDSRVTVVEKESDELQVNVTSNHDDIINLSLLLGANVTSLQSKDEEIRNELIEMEVEFEADIAGLYREDINISN